MKTVAILGSRDPEGQTARAAKALLQAVANAGWETESFLLPEKSIERCRQCDERGWGICRSEGRCVIEDDFGDVVGKLREADVAVFATPVYFSDLSESMKALLDRLRRCTRHGTGKEGIDGKIAIGICVAGGGGGGAPSCTVSLERVLNTCGFEVLDIVPARRQNLDLKLDVLRRTGEWLVEQMA